MGNGPPVQRPVEAVYTDIHSHLIWGVDDGAETEEQTRRMLEAAAADGISAIIATPHITPGFVPFPRERFEANLAKAREFVCQQKYLLTICTGSEILYTEHTVRMLREGKVPTLAESRYVLVEFDPGEAPQRIILSLQSIAAAGYIPVIAHLERCRRIRSLQQVREIKSSCRALVQINAATLLCKPPLFRRAFMEGLFREGLADLVATDTHAMPGRETCLTRAMSMIEAKYGKETADRLNQNAIKIIPDSA